MPGTVCFDRVVVVEAVDQNFVARQEEVDKEVGHDLGYPGYGLEEEGDPSFQAGGHVVEYLTIYKHKYFSRTGTSTGTARTNSKYYFCMGQVEILKDELYWTNGRNS